MKVCKIHGQLNKDQIILNRLSPKGKAYYRCKVCRNNSEKNRIEKTKYITTPRKHFKNKVPDFVPSDNKPHSYTILYKFKMTSNEYYALLKKQNNVCKICKKPETQIKRKSDKIKMLSIDHCHKTGKIRGLLCFKCNSGLGQFQDSIDLLKAAIDYLKITSQ
jgi:hypothetical protein